MKTYIIAEAGVNHNGSYQRAKKLITIAASAGADAVKFQTFTANNLVTKNAPLASYQKKNSLQKSQHDMLRALELSKNEFIQLKKYAQRKKIDFLSTPFDMESLNFLVKNLRLNTIKISSGDLLNAPLLLAAAQAKVKIIVSTGMANLKEIQFALSVIAFGYLHGRKIPTSSSLSSSLKSRRAQLLLRKKIVILHCTTEYPAPFHEINLRVLKTIYEKFQIPVGYSDHTLGPIASLGAVALGASMIEKHFTINKKLPGPDHKMSLDPQELKQFVKEIRILETTLGSSEKKPTASEKKNMVICRKSLVAARDIKKGDTFTMNNLTVKRPGSGISSALFWEFLGKKAKRNFKQDSLISD